MPAPIYIEKRNLWTEAFANLLPVLTNFLMAKEYFSKGISEKEFKELKEKIPNIEEYFEKKGGRYVAKEGINIENITDTKVKDVLLEYYQRENLKNKYKTNPFTYLGGIQAIVSNPVVMSYLSNISGGVEERERKRKTKETDQFIQSLFAGLLPQFLGNLAPSKTIDLDYEKLGQILPLMFMMKLFQGSK